MKGTHCDPCDPRALAVAVLKKIAQGVSSQAALDIVLYVHILDARDTALVTELVYGYLRMHVRITFILQHFLPKLHKLPPAIRNVLGISVYSILFLDKVPAHAAVNWAVGYIRNGFGQRLANLCNAVLRNVIRLGAAPLEMAFYGDVNTLACVATYYSMPLWIAQLWFTGYGMEATRHLLQRAASPPYPCLRLCPQHMHYKTLREALTSSTCALSVGSSSFAFAPRTVPETIDGVSLASLRKEGAFVWQSAGSVVSLAQIPQWQGPVWDACAGQGGKTLALLDRGTHVGLASDMHIGRLRLLQRTLEVQGYAVPLVMSDVTRPCVTSWSGDILLDAPCSGLGTLARRPEIRLRRSAADIDALQQLQVKMLDCVWRILARGCALVYITCTLNPEENSLQIQRFLERTSGAQLEIEWQTPHTHPWLEGMYVARVRKQ